MLNTQSILTYTAEAFTFFYTCATVFDFVAGLLTAWQNAGAKAQLPVELKPTAQEQAIAPQTEVTPDPWTLPMSERQVIALPTEQPIIKSQLLLAPAPQKVATLEWVEQNLPAVEVYAIEMPDALVLAKARMPQAEPVIEIASRQQLVAAGIRRCKQLAR